MSSPAVGTSRSPADWSLLLRSRRYQLTTLFCPDIFRLAPIVRSHPSLRTLRIFGHPMHTLPDLESASILVLSHPRGGELKSLAFFPDRMAMEDTSDLTKRLRAALCLAVGSSLPLGHRVETYNLYIHTKSFQDPMKLKVFLSGAYFLRKRPKHSHPILCAFHSRLGKSRMSLLKLIIIKLISICDSSHQLPPRVFMRFRAQ